MLENQFNYFLTLEGRKIVIDEVEHKVLFRRKDENTIMFAPVTEQVTLGTQFTYCGEPYLILKSITDTNLIYNKYLCTKCNDSFKIQFSNKVAEFDCITEPLSASLNGNKSGITIGSKQEFIISLTDEAKRIKVNSRFLCGCTHMAYIIVDIAYINNLCYIYTERDELNNNDDIDSMIADKLDDIVTDIEPPVDNEIIVTPTYSGDYIELWQYDTKTFTISLEGADEVDYSVECDNTDDITVIFDGVNSFSCYCVNGTGEVVTVVITDNISEKTTSYKLKLVRFM